MIREILYKEQTEIGLLEECHYKDEKYNYRTYEMSTKIDKNYAKLMVFEITSKIKALQNYKRKYAIIFAFGNKKDVNEFVIGTNATKIKNVNTTSDIRGLIFAYKALQFIIGKMKMCYSKFAIITGADDDQRFRVYKRLLKIGFVQSGVSFSHNHCYYFYFHDETNWRYK